MIALNHFDGPSTTLWDQSMKKICNVDTGAISLYVNDLCLTVDTTNLFHLFVCFSEGTVQTFTYRMGDAQAVRGESFCLGSSPASAQTFYNSSIGNCVMLYGDRSLLIPSKGLPLRPVVLRNAVCLDFQSKIYCALTE